MAPINKLGRAGAAYRIAKSKSLPLWPKLFILVALIYGISPIDIVPDFLPIIGWIDDIIVALTLIGPALIRILAHRKSG